MDQITASPLSTVPSDTACDKFSAIEHRRVALPREELRKLCIPAPRPRIAARIDHLAELIGGDLEPLYCGRYNLLVGARLPQARIIILGTACGRPLLLEEARNLQAISGEDVIVLRLEENQAGDGVFTFDFLATASRECLEEGSLWAEQPGAPLWLGRRIHFSPWVRLAADGAQASPAPTNDHQLLQRGFDVGRVLLPVSGSGARLG